MFNPNFLAPISQNDKNHISQISSTCGPVKDKMTRFRNLPVKTVLAMNSKDKN